MLKTPINRLTLLISIIVSLTLINGCARKPTDYFSENFYVFKNDDGSEHFAYIIKLKGMTDRSTRADYINENARTSGQQRQNTPRQNSQNVEAAFQPEDPNDVNVSLKFRMEELAHQKLQETLQARNYCRKGIKIESEEYLEYRYKIKGYCVE
jgi:hypothetical protein